MLPRIRNNQNGLQDPVCQYQIRKERFCQASQEKCYIVQSFTLFEDIPSMSLLGCTGNLYTINFLPVGTIQCSCPDTTIPCKHIIFLFSPLKHNPSPGPINVTVPQCILAIQRYRPFPPHALHETTNNLCLTFLYKPCVLCNRPNNGCLYVCDKCGFLCHAFHLPRLLPQRCPGCNLSWMPYTSALQNGYRNFSSLLHRFHPLDIQPIRQHPPNNPPNNQRQPLHGNQNRTHIIPQSPSTQSSSEQSTSL